MKDGGCIFQGPWASHSSPPSSTSLASINSSSPSGLCLYALNDIRAHRLSQMRVDTMGYDGPSMVDVTFSRAGAGVLSTLSSHSTLTLALLLSLPILVTFTYWVFIYPFFVSPLRHLPGPKDNSFLVGQCHKYLQVAWIPQLYREWTRQWPDSPFIRYLGVGNSESLIANNLAAYREVLHTKNSFFVKPDLTRRCANVVIGDGLPFAEGHVHRQQRAVLSKPFSTTRVKGFVPVLQAKARQLVSILGSQRSMNGEVEAESHIWKSVLDVIGIEVLGTDLNHLGSPYSPLHRLFGRTMQQSPLGHIIHFFSSYLPLRHLIPIPANHDFVKSCAEVRDYLEAHVRERRKSHQRGIHKSGPDTPDALQCMIEQEDALSDKDIVEYLLNLMVLGHDTTACALVWAIHVLADRPDLQERLRSEVTDMRSQCHVPSFTAIDQLSYLDNFLREVLRVYCPVAYIPRQATSDVEVAGVLLPKGTVVQMSPAVINMHPKIWGPDADAFNPDRWDDLQGDAASAYAFESFHNGPRMCIGKQLSMMEMKINLIELVSRFRVDALEPGKPVEFASPSFTLRPKELLRVRLTEMSAPTSTTSTTT